MVLLHTTCAALLLLHGMHACFISYYSMPCMHVLLHSIACMSCMHVLFHNITCAALHLLHAMSVWLACRCIPAAVILLLPRALRWFYCISQCCLFSCMHTARAALALLHATHVWMCACRYHGIHQCGFIACRMRCVVLLHATCDGFIAYHMRRVAIIAWHARMFYFIL